MADFVTLKWEGASPAEEHKFDLHEGRLDWTVVKEYFQADTVTTVEFGAPALFNNGENMGYTCRTFPGGSTIKVEVVKKASDQSVSAPAQGDKYEKLKRRVYDMKPPSTAGAKVGEFMAKEQMNEAQGPLLLNCRPPAASSPVPVQLLVPAFNQITTAATAAWPVMGQEDLPDVECTDFALYFCQAMSASFKDEDHRQDVVMTLLQAFLGSHLNYRKANRGERLPDICVSTDKAQLMHVQVKDEMGSSGDAMLQGQLYYADYIVTPQAYGLLATSLCPVLLLEVVGPLLRISGHAYSAGAVVCQPLTPMFNLLDLHKAHPEQVLVLARTLSALRSTLHELSASYASEEVPVSDTLPCWGHSPTPMPHHLQLRLLQQQASSVDMMGTSKLVYEVHGAVLPGGSERQSYIIKYTQRYGAAVHRAWAAQNFAPQLLGVELLPGGWYAVSMECLGFKDGWWPLTALLVDPAGMEVPDAIRLLGVPLRGTKLQLLHKRVREVLDAAHNVPIPDAPVAAGNSVGGVHGDMRDPNILVQLPRIPGDGQHSGNADSVPAEVQISSLP
eukprot:CAMPEP_0202891096 /NCGR_PEP_ID=MMETSP1392-20130828/1266_1 /ASSEMBLY_ACC=CAM_ASM_000868 /TAXON_ID=225041 /ORGANISM="Chlamydomonas chlamydogama, Strain SAG 11-48b" /LENGTH=558 /DNA_ID=CAMNT_0049574771 /DNA_START=112 /DNA_END=1785 /DNA_ORIENTATION=+